MKRNNSLTLCGVHPVEMLLKHQPEKVKKLLVAKGNPEKRLAKIVDDANKKGISVEKTSPDKLSSICDSSQHQGIGALVSEIGLKSEKDIEKLVVALDHPPLVLILDSIQDPHNLGAALRTADAANVDFVVTTKDRSAGLSPTVHKVACGATVVRPIVQAANLARAMEILKSNNIWITGTKMDAKSSLYDLDFTGASAFVLGNEGQGIRKLTEKHCDQSVYIPMQGEVESLNISVAAAICLYEAVRQRL